MNKDAARSIEKEFDEGKISLSFMQKLSLDKTKRDLSEQNGFIVSDTVLPKEEDAYKIIKNDIIPFLHYYAKHINRETYLKYQGNLCRHSTLAVTRFLKGYMPNWNWKMFEITYSALLFDMPYTCTHAFIIGSFDGHMRAIDMWDDLSLKTWTNIDKEEYPFWLDAIEKDRKIISMVEMNYDDMCSVTNEFIFGDFQVFLKIYDYCLANDFAMHKNLSIVTY